MTPIDDALLCPAAAIAVASAVMIYVYARGGAWGSDHVAFAACAFALGATLVVLITGWPPSASASASASVEGFLDSAKSLADELLVPRLDRLLMAITGQNLDGSAPDNRRPQKIQITANRFAPADAKTAASLQLEYKRIAFVLCRMSESFPEKFDAAMTALKAPPPIYDETPAAVTPVVAASTSPPTPTPSPAGDDVQL